VKPCDNVNIDYQGKCGYGAQVSVDGSAKGGFTKEYYQGE